MPFSKILGQEPALQTLERALASGHVHHAYRFEGPAGVGKELAAMALAQALLCETGGPGACGSCSACKRAVTFSESPPHVPVHPDLVLIERGLYRAALSSTEASGIGIEQIRRIVLSRLGFSPHEGRALVFIVREASELTPQAANALLKTLEEPPSKTYFVLLTSRPHRLLDTIRSRTLPVRFSALPDAVVAEILQRHGLDPGIATLGQGSAGLAMELANEDAVRERKDFVTAVLEALEAPNLAVATRFAEGRRFERDTLKELLGHLAQSFAARGREHVASAPAITDRAARHYELTLQSLEYVEQNTQPQLTLEALIARLRAQA
jgi:DNA polymerase III subunit delta'